MNNSELYNAKLWNTLIEYIDLEMNKNFGARIVQGATQNVYVRMWVPSVDGTQIARKRLKRLCIEIEAAIVIVFTLNLYWL